VALQQNNYILLHLRFNHVILHFSGIICCEYSANHQCGVWPFFCCNCHVCCPCLLPQQATMIIADASTCLEVSGNGELLEPADGVHAIGSGARFAIAAARALMVVPDLTAFEIAQRAMKLAAAKCVYTNDCLLWEVIGADGKLQSGGSSSSSTGTGQ
jgi:hypothetical protein